MENTSKIDLRQGLSGLLTQLLDIQMRAGAWLANSLKQKQLPWEGSCCDIPTPCWMPKNLGEVTSHVCPGATAVVRIRITNCDVQAHNYHFVVRGEAAAQVALTPSSLAIGPLEKGMVTAQFSLPADASECQDSESLILIQGLSPGVSPASIPANSHNSCQSVTWCDMACLTSTILPLTSQR